MGARALIECSLLEVGFNQGLIGNINFVSLLFKASQQVFWEADRDRSGSGFEVGKENRHKIFWFKIIDQADFSPEISFFVFVLEPG